MGRAKLAVACVAMFVGGWQAFAQGPAEAQSSNTSRQRVEQMLAELPDDALAPAHRTRVRQIIKKPAVFCQTPVEMFPSSPLLYEWLLEHPLWVTELWQKLGLDVAPVELLEDGHRICDPERGSIQFHVVCQQPEMRILYCIAEAKKSLLPRRLRAEMVIVQKYRFLRRPDGDYLLAQRLYGFVTADGATLKAVMKIAPNASERVSEQCLQEMMIYFSMMCRIIQVQPNWVLDQLAQLSPAYPDSERTALQSIVSELAAKRPEDVLPAGFQDLLPGLKPDASLEQ